MRNYDQLTLDQRYQIQECRSYNNKFKLATIAARVGVSVSTISRELRRNLSGRGYQAKFAHRQAMARRVGKCRARMSAQNCPTIIVAINRSHISIIVYIDGFHSS